MGYHSAMPLRITEQVLIDEVERVNQTLNLKPGFPGTFFLSRSGRTYGLGRFIEIPDSRELGVECVTFGGYTSRKVYEMLNMISYGIRVERYAQRRETNG
jgi:hypothetical protein